MVGANLYEGVAHRGVAIETAAVGLFVRAVPVVEFAARFRVVRGPLDADAIHHFPRDRLIVTEPRAWIVITIRVAAVRLVCGATPYQLITRKLHLARICAGTFGREKRCDLAIGFDTTFPLVTSPVDAAAVAIGCAQADSGRARFNAATKETVSRAFAIRDALSRAVGPIISDVCGVTARVADSIFRVAIGDSIARFENSIASCRISSGIR